MISPPNNYSEIVELKLKLSKERVNHEEELASLKNHAVTLEQELKKALNLNKLLQGELKTERDRTDTTETLLDEKTLENLFDSEIDSEDDSEEDGYGDIDGKVIRRHRNDILDGMAVNDRLYHRITYLKKSK